MHWLGTSISLLILAALTLNIARSILEVTTWFLSSRSGFSLVRAVRSAVLRFHVKHSRLW